MKQQLSLLHLNQYSFIYFKEGGLIATLFSFNQIKTTFFYYILDMIQAYTETDFKAYLSTEDNRINTSVAKTQIRHLVKLINDMDGSIDYVYPTETINNRFTEMTFTYEADALTVDLWAGEIHLLPAGYWKYEVYEVSWIGTVTVLKNFAPSTETEVLEPAANVGIVQGLVTKGKMYLAEKEGTEQVQYTQYPETSGTNYIYYGQ